MKERPILFNSKMVRAILDGRKNQTRRILKVGRKQEFSEERRKLFNRFYDHLNESWIEPADCPHGKPGDRLWVREKFAYVFRGKNKNSYYGPDRGIHCEISDDGNFNIEYAATTEQVDWDGGWKPSIHMPRWASRINLEITNVRVERMQEGGDREFWGEEQWNQNPWVWVIEFKVIT